MKSTTVVMLWVPMILKVLMIMTYFVWLVRSEYSKTKQTKFYTATSYFNHTDKYNFTKLCDETHNVKCKSKYVYMRQLMVSALIVSIDRLVIRLIFLQTQESLSWWYCTDNVWQYLSSLDKNILIGTTGSLSSSVASDLMQFAPVEIRGDIVYPLNEEEGFANLISSGSSSLVRKRLMYPAINK